MPESRPIEEVAEWFLADNPDLSGDAGEFRFEGGNLLLPAHLAERFLRWMWDRSDAADEPDDTPPSAAEAEALHEALLGEFLAEHPQHVAGTCRMTVDGREQLMAELTTARAFVAWAKDRGYWLRPDKADAFIAAIDGMKR